AVYDCTITNVSVTITPSRSLWKYGEEGTASATIEPSYANQKVTWRSSNTALVTVDETGHITVVGEPTGETSVTITATSTDDPSKSNSQVIRVQRRTITITYTDKNTTPVNVTHYVGQTITLPGFNNFTAFKAPTGATFRGWKIGDTEYSAGDSFTCPETNVTAEAVYDCTITNVSVTITPSRSLWKYGEEGTASATIEPSYANQEVTWRSSNTALVTVDETGHITVVGEPTGETSVTITATSTYDPSKSNSQVIRVQRRTITITYTDKNTTPVNVTHYVGQTITLPGFNNFTAFKAPTGARFRGWKIGDTEYSAGDSFTCPETNVTAEAVYEYPVTLSCNPATGGTVSGDGSYQEKTNATVQATPQDGYKFVRWTENGTQVSTSAAYTFRVTYARNLVAAFETLPTSTYAVTVINDGNGTASANVASGTTDTEVTLTATPNSGYQFKEWQVVSGGVTIENDKFKIGNANVVMKAVFEPITYTVSKVWSPLSGGSITINGGKTEFAKGETVTLSINESSGYTLKKISVNGTEILFSPNGSGGGYTASFDMPAEAVKVTAEFERTSSAPTYSVTVSGGTIEGGILSSG
ncbi:MAG: Ig-like domain-containing protein, partial [Bacteroidaceae bacterium]|nr:Ig-like domain-containing protein [Bacteroidaceae bacterium]